MSEADAPKRKRKTVIRRKSTGTGTGAERPPRPEAARKPAKSTKPTKSDKASKASKTPKTSKTSKRSPERKQEPLTEDLEDELEDDFEEDADEYVQQGTETDLEGTTSDEVRRYGQTSTRAAAPGERLDRGVRGAQGDEARARIAERSVRPDVVKLPQFPPATLERPDALDEEERRRQEIAAAQEIRRRKILEAIVDESERERQQREWDEQDSLLYVPDPDDREVEVYPIHEPFAYVQLVRNLRTHELLYHVIEPRLTHEEELLLDFIEETLVDVLDLDPAELEGKELDLYIRERFEQVIDDYSIRLGDSDDDEEAAEAIERLLYYVMRDFIGEGPIDVLIRDNMIEDISCDGPHERVFIYHRKYESLQTTIRFPDHETLDSFVIRLAQRAGKHVSIAEPILDATMRDGSRLQATLAKEVSSFGSTFTIRKFKEVPFTPVDLVRFGTMDPSMVAYLWMIIQHGMSAIYAGGTASDKTTATNAVLQFIPPQMKIISIEDTRELQLPQPNWIAGITRDGFGPPDEHGRQAGQIDMFQLLKNALRQRPEYIVVGEVRGKEAYNLFQAMATGHAAYGTMHADSVDAVIHRLEGDPINIPRALLEALDVVAVQMQTRVGGKRVRRTKQLTEIVGLDPNTREILTNEVFRWDPATDTFRYSGVSYALERIATETGQNDKEVLRELEDRTAVIQYLVDQGIDEYRRIAEVVATYYKDREHVMQYVEEGLRWP